MIEYPIWIEHLPVSVQVDSEDELAEGLSLFTQRYFTEMRKDASTVLDPLGLRRFRIKQGSPVNRNLCPHSWPADVYTRMALEQILMDTSGMMVRYWHNHLAWLEQPGVYTDCFMRVQGARRVVSEWEKKQPKKKDDEPSAPGR